MAGQLILQQAFKRALLVAPLFIGSVWFAIFYRRTFEPLMKFIALRSLHETQDEAISLSGSRYEEDTHGRTGSDHGEDENSKFVNPSLVAPLEEIWVSKSRAHRASFRANGDHEESA